MITLATAADILLQVHKNHLTAPLPGTTCVVTLTGFTGKTVAVTAAVQVLANCYLLRITDVTPLRKLGLNCVMSLAATGGSAVLYTTPVQLYIPQISA